jgi:phage RecT family recombinase
MNDEPLQLQEPLNRYAEIARDNMASALAPLSATIDRQAFATQCMAELNLLVPYDLERIKMSQEGSGAVAVKNAAIIGLAPGKANQFCFFLVRSGAIQLEMGFRGFLELSYKNKFLKLVTCDVVLNGEEFEYGTNTDGDYLSHPKDLSRQPSKGKVVAAYCLWHNQTGGHALTVMTRAELDKVEACSRGSYSPWKDDINYCEMAKKSPLRRASKMWPRSEAMSHAAYIDEALELGHSQGELELAEQPIDLDNMSVEPNSEDESDG